MCLNTIEYYFMIDNQFTSKIIVSSKDVKATFLSIEPLPNDFSKIFVLRQPGQPRYPPPSHVEFHDRWQNNLRREEAQRNLSGRIRFKKEKWPLI